MGRVARKVLLVELNEITWKLVDRFWEKLPTYQKMKREGCCGICMANEDAPQLDPWIAWTTVYTGRPQEEHNVRFLEQPPETVKGPRVWEIAADAGKTIGVFGSIMSWPPRSDVEGFWVPSTFSPATDTFPASMEPIQQLNLSHTRAHNPRSQGGVEHKSKLSRVMDLFRLGLRFGTCAKIARFLLKTHINPDRKWEKVSLQPIINADFFEKAYKTYRPQLATFHANHVAHYQHHYWRAMDSSPFFIKATRDESKKFGDAIGFGYEVSDEILARMLELVDDQTVVIVASALGQKPYVKEEFPEGRAIVRVADIQQIVELCACKNACTAIPMMANQWNLKIPDEIQRARAERILSTAWVGQPEQRLFFVEVSGDTINFTPRNPKEIGANLQCIFPAAGGKSFKFTELCAVEDETPKEGYHDREGVIMMRGPGIKAGKEIHCSDLDIAPTILHLLDLPIPPYMKGRLLTEAFDDAPTLQEQWEVSAA